MAVIIVYIFVLFHRGAGSEQALAPVLGKGSYDGEQEGGVTRKRVVAIKRKSAIISIRENFFFLLIMNIPLFFF